MNEEKIGTKIYRMNEINNMLCNRNISKYAKVDSNTIQNYKLKDKDILFNRTNSLKFVGRTGIFRRFSNDDIVFASYLVRIRPKTETVTPEYLTAFLNTKYGVTDIKRRARISINQSNVNPEELKRVEIPLLSRELQERITFLFDRAFKLLQESEIKYNEAQNLLLSELGLTNWNPKHQLSFVGRYSDTEKAKRIDAEYFQPKYEEIINRIKNYQNGWDRLGNLVTLKDNNFKPKDKEQYQYIELANISGNGEIVDCMNEEGQDLPTRARRKVKTGDVIASSIEGSLSSIALIEKEYNQALCSTGFHVINSEYFNPATLIVLLKSKVGQLQLKKACSGTILTAINKDEFRKIVLPKVIEAKQLEIQQKITESFNLRKQSKHLLEYAKKALEMAIEQSEIMAIDWLKNKLSK